MSTTIKTNLNSSSNGCSLAALKKHINACLQRWRRKHITKNQQKGDYSYQDEKCNCNLRQNLSKRILKFSCKECSLVKRTTVYCKSLNTKVCKYIHPQQQFNKDNSTNLYNSEGPRQYGRKVEIVAKLLSSTLIDKRNTSTTASKREEVFFEKGSKVIQSSISTSDFIERDMTITDINFLELREEYPDLNSEIRSILTARTQEGATISQIRDDYRKLTGLKFPLYEDVTEFLLTIPYVTAYCTEKGTRIFNILPMDKTKHIHEMVTNQKVQPEIYPKPKWNSYYRERERNDNYQPLHWRQNSNRRLSQCNTANLEEEPINIKNYEQQEQLAPSIASNNGSEGLNENNCFYQDNCNYLYNRICNQNLQEPIKSHILEKAPQILANPEIIPVSNAVSKRALNKFDSNKNNINNLHNLFQVQQIQYHHKGNHLRNANARYSSSHNHSRQPMPILSSNASSPTPKSWYTNESFFTDSDYEAHLLDFLLLGDDFFLYMARMELRCKFKKNQRVLQSGLCVSGQTISAAIKRIKSLSDQQRSIILNIGSVDIMRGKQLIQIEHEFRELISTMLKKGFKPILTTLAPLANYSHNNEMKVLLQRFNDFIKREGQRRNLIVIDVWKCLVNEKQHVLFDCYQNEPRNVTGTSESYLFWNKIGRQRVLQLIESNLEY